MTRLRGDNVDEGDETVDEGLFLDFVVVGDGRGEGVGGSRVGRVTRCVRRVVDFLYFDHGGGEKLGTKRDQWPMGAMCLQRYRLVACGMQWHACKGLNPGSWMDPGYWILAQPGTKLKIQLLALLALLALFTYLHIYYLFTFLSHTRVLFPVAFSHRADADEASQRPFGFGSAHTNAKLSPFPAAAALVRCRLQRPWQCGLHPCSTSISNSSSSNHNHNHNRKRIPRSTSPSPNTNSSSRTALLADPFPSTLSRIPLLPLPENRTQLATHAGLLPTPLRRCVDRSLQCSVCHP
jgi:hypothetical protein